jgi:hypothetical protein
MAKEDPKNSTKASAAYNQTGLLKSIFMQTLNKYGVALSEKETALISSVFGLGSD